MERKADLGNDRHTLYGIPNNDPVMLRNRRIRNDRAAAGKLFMGVHRRPDKRFVPGSGTFLIRAAEVFRCFGRRGVGTPDRAGEKIGRWLRAADEEEEEDQETRVFRRLQHTKWNVRANTMFQFLPATRVYPVK